MALPIVKIYVAGKWSEKGNIKLKMIELMLLGHTITHDWTIYEADPSHRLADMADHDVRGVLDAEVVCLLMIDPTYSYRGTYTELGVALGSGDKTIFIICPDPKAECRTNVFFHHSSIKHLNSWDEFVAIIKTIK